MRTSCLLVVVGVLSACGVQSVVTDGTYQSAETTGPLVNATLVVDVKGKTASVTLSGAGSPVVLQLTAVPPAQWETGCPTNYTSVSVETWKLSPDPAVLGTLSLANPRLVAGCGLDVAKPDEVVLEGTSQPNDTSNHLVFHRLTR